MQEEAGCEAPPSPHAPLSAASSKETSGFSSIALSIVLTLYCLVLCFSDGLSRFCIVLLLWCDVIIDVMNSHQSKVNECVVEC